MYHSGMSRHSLALALGLGILASCGCGSATLQECRLHAVEDAVPPDPGLVTVNDVISVIHKLEACKATPPDAGVPK